MTTEQTNEAAAYLVNAAKLRLRRELNLCRPSVILEAAIQRTPNGRFCASYSGVFALGDTPEEAFSNFDVTWNQGE